MRHHDLWSHAALNVRAYQHLLARAIRPQLQHFNRVTEVEVEDFVGRHTM
jgi:hypothetical protein